MLYLYCSKLYNAKLLWMSKIWCDGHNLDVVSADMNMCGKDVMS